MYLRLIKQKREYYFFDHPHLSLDDFFDENGMCFLYGIQLIMTIFIRNQHFFKNFDDDLKVKRKSRNFQVKIFYLLSLSLQR